MGEREWESETEKVGETEGWERVKQRNMETEKKRQIGGENKGEQDREKEIDGEKDRGRQTTHYLDG